MKMSLRNTVLAVMLVGATSVAWADDYVIDTQGAHAFIQFKIAHLGYSWLLGRFNDFEGQFSYDEKNPDASTVKVTINTASLDTNHAERDKHLRSADFFDVSKYPTATFESTGFKENADGTAVLSGNLTLRGVTKAIDIDVKHVGHGEDPWGGYRRGFEGKTKIALKDFGIPYDLGPAASEAELFLSVEGIRK